MRLCGEKQFSIYISLHKYIMHMYILMVVQKVQPLKSTLYNLVQILLFLALTDISKVLLHTLHQEFF